MKRHMHVYMGSGLMVNPPHDIMYLTYMCVYTWAVVPVTHLRVALWPCSCRALIVTSRPSPTASCHVDSTSRSRRLPHLRQHISQRKVQP